MPPTTKTLSPAELAKLEHAFATDPASEAYKPLAEAYLGMGRFMEAMVVCKKGVKAHANEADPRVLLAKVYAAQGKDKKALEELAGALQVAPNDVPALRMAGSIELKGGEQAGKEKILKAFSLSPTDEETLNAMKEHGVEAPKAAPPPPPPPPAPAQSGPPMLTPVAGPGAQPSTVPGPPVLQPGTQPGANGASRTTTGARPALQPRTTAPGQPRASQPVRRAPVVYDESPSGISEVSELRTIPNKKGGGASKAIFFLLLFAVPLAAGGYYGYGQWTARIEREVKKQVQVSQDLLKNDTFDSYKKACEAAEKALDLNPHSLRAHRYLAYGYTVRWGEHERDDQMRQRAEEHLKEGAQKRDVEDGITYQFAAEALFTAYSGKPAEAVKALEEQVKTIGKRSGLLNLTLGILVMNEGDLERAKEYLEAAQSAAPDDPRVFVALGNLARRRGNDTLALTYFNSALRYTKNSHPEALAGTALLILDQENPGEGYIMASKYIKTLMEADPPPSPRQLAMASVVRALLVSRVSRDIPNFTSKEFQKRLEDGTGVSADESKARAEISRMENDAFGKDRSNPDLYVVKAKRFYYEGKFDDAAAEVRKAIEINGSLAHYHAELARILMRKEGGAVQAEEALRKALSLVPNSPKLLALLGQAQYRQKKIDEATTTLEKALEDVKTRNPEARYLLGTIYRVDKKDYDKAVKSLELAALQYSSDQTMAATAWDDVAQSYEAKDDREKARTTYEKALNADKDYAPTYCHYAHFLKKLTESKADPKDVAKMKELAADSLKREPQGTCAAEMKSLAGQ